MKPAPKTDSELAADARMVVAELNRLHGALLKRGITVDWYHGNQPAEIVVEYSRVKKEVL
jgi:hypothetical protein